MVPLVIYSDMLTKFKLILLDPFDLICTYVLISFTFSSDNSLQLLQGHPGRRPSGSHE